MNNANPQILNDPEVANAFEVLSKQLSASDLKLFLHELARTHAVTVEPWAVLGQQRLDRFCEASSIDAVGLATTGATALQLAEDAQFDAVQLAPLGPAGAASTFGGVEQNNVLTTMQLCEVVSDPTNALALVAAAQRRLLRDTSGVTRLCTMQRVMRAKQFDAPGAMAHFSMFGLVSVGRDRGRRRFEVEELERQLRVLVDLINQVQSIGRIKIEVSDNSGRREEAVALVKSLSDSADTEVTPARPARREYYPNLCTSVSWSGRGATVELGGGGVTSWPNEFCDDQQERLVTSAITVDGLVELLPRRRRS